MRFPVVAGEKPDVELTGRQARIARNNAELCRAPSPACDLRRRKAEPLKQQRPAITFDGSDRHQNRLPRGVQNRIVVRIKSRRRASTKSEGSCKVLGRYIVIPWVVEPHSKSPTVPSTNSRHIVLKLKMLLRIHRMPGR